MLDKDENEKLNAPNGIVVILLLERVMEMDCANGKLKVLRGIEVILL